MITAKLDIISDSQIQTKGIQALKNELGVVDTIRFLEQFDNGGYGDYTKEKYLKEEKDLTIEEILNLFK